MVPRFQVVLFLANEDDLHLFVFSQLNEIKFDKQEQNHATSRVQSLRQRNVKVAIAAGEFVPRKHYLPLLKVCF